MLFFVVFTFFVTTMLYGKNNKNNKNNKKMLQRERRYFMKVFVKTKFYIDVEFFGVHETI